MNEIKNRKCQAIATSTGEPCKRKPLLWSKYCLFHVEKIPLLISGGVGAILSLTITLTWNIFIPSQELKELRKEVTARRNAERKETKRAAQLDKQLDELTRSSKEQGQKVAAELQEVKSQLEPFIELAKMQYPDKETSIGLQKLTKEFEILRSRTKELENKTRPRGLTDRQAESISSKLQKFGSNRILIQYDPTDIEARNFANQIGATITSAGWQVDKSALQAMNPLPGLHIWLRDNPESVAVASALHKALISAGLNASGGYSDSGRNFSVKLYVGPKPQ